MKDSDAQDVRSVSWSNQDQDQDQDMDFRLGSGTKIRIRTRGVESESMSESSMVFPSFWSRSWSRGKIMAQDLEQGLR